MKKVIIKYNPYLLKTDISIDGNAPRSNSSLVFGKQRLQEWAEKFVDSFLDEYRDANVTIEFTGSLADFLDLKETIESKSDKIHVTNWKHNCVQDVEEVEKKIIQIFQEIQNGPVEALKDQKIIDSFRQATSAQFGINVVATMSAGKSTLINAILGKKLMPMAQKATTATIVRIIASNQDYFSAIAFDKNDVEVARNENISYDTMKVWNTDERISQIDIYGPIPCVDSVGMRLVLIDTPGPNNSRDERHKAMTYGMLESSEKSLVLFVMNSTQSGVDDEANVLDYVCSCMQKGGKQSRERYIFAVNKLDEYKTDDDCVDSALKDVRKILDERDIIEPNLFPTAALPCLQLRSNAQYPDELDSFKNKIKRSDEYKFDEYYHFNHLPTSSQIRLKNLEGEDHKLELHTGIASIEEAIRLYINKYARTMKVKDLVDSFNKRLIELKAIADLEKNLRNNRAEKDRIVAEISSISKQIKSGQSATEYATLIDNIDVSRNVNSEVNTMVGGFLTRIDKMISNYTNETKVHKDKAEKSLAEIESKRSDMIAQLDSKIQSIFNTNFKLTYDTIIEQYRKKLATLGFKTDDNAFQFNPLDFVGTELFDLQEIISNASFTKDEGEYHSRTVTYEVQVERSKWDPRYWFGNKYKTETREKTENYWVAKYVDYVDMHEVVSEYFGPLYNDLVNAKTDIPSHIAEETKRLKKTLKEQLGKVEKILAKKLNDLKARVSHREQTQAEIKRQESNLAWMNNIIERVNNLINY